MFNYIKSKLIYFFDEIEYSYVNTEWLSPISIIHNFGWLIGIRRYGPMNQFLWRVNNFLTGKHYHKVIINNKSFSKYEYQDKTEILLHAAFQVLVNYIEQEKPFEHIVMRGMSYENDYLELYALYKWWTVERPLREEEVITTEERARIAVLNRLPRGSVEHELRLKEYRAVFNKHETEDTQKLMRLVELRHHLWT